MPALEVWVIALVLGTDSLVWGGFSIDDIFCSL